MRRLRWAAVAAVTVMLAAAGFGAAQVVGPSEVCATATASTPDHVIAVDGGAVHTIPGDVATATQCAPVPTETVTVPGPTTTVTETVTVPADPPDTTGPTMPQNFRLDSSTTSSLTLAWDASTDDTGVAGYEIKFHNDPDYIDAGASLTHTFGGLNCDGQYNLDLRAYDAAGNRSDVAAVGPISPGCDPVLTNQRVLFGASTPPYAKHGTTTREAEARWLESKMGRKLDITRHYVKAPNAWTGDGAQTTVDNGRIPVVTFTSGGDTWTQVANGSLDSYVRTQSANMKARGGLWCKAYIAFENEPEAEGFKGTPAQYRAAYQHIMQVGNAAGFCGHWTTAFMEFSWQSGSGRNPEAWVPDGIDTLGVHVYFTRVGTCGDGIRSFSSGVDDPYATAVSHNLDMGIWEAGYSTAVGADPRAKGDFFRSIPATLPNFPRIIGITYWHQDSGKCADANSYRIDSSSAALQGWVDAGHSAILGG